MNVAEISDLYRRIAGVTTRFEFTHPVSGDDLEQFRDHLQTAVGDGFLAGAEMMTNGHVLVCVFTLEPWMRRCYAREMLVLECGDRDTARVYPTVHDPAASSSAPSQ